MGYWDATGKYVAEHGKPNCPNCNSSNTVAEDDHGRFHCFSCGQTFDAETGSVLRPLAVIPQVDVTGMSDKQKAAVHPLNRLHAPATAIEQAFFDVACRALRGDPGADEAYEAAAQALDAERQQAGSDCQ